MERKNTIEVQYEGDTESEIFIITDKDVENAIAKESELAVKCNNAKKGDIITLASGIKLKLVNKE